MNIKWIPLDPDKVSPEELLNFRNRVLVLDSEPSDLEIQALQNQINECVRDDTYYNLVALQDASLIAWVNGKFVPNRQTDMIRVVFFDSKNLSQQGVENLFNELESSLPHQYKRIEIYGLGPGRESDLEMIKKTGYREAYDIIHYRWVTGTKPGFPGDKNLFYEHEFDGQTAYEIYRDAFKDTWDSEMVEPSEFQDILKNSDERFSFVAYLDNLPAGMVIVNPGLSSKEAYLQIIAAVSEMKGQRIGDLMIAYVLEKISSEGIHLLALSTRADNTKMKKLAERWNFVEQFRETVLFKENMNR